MPEPLLLTNEVPCTTTETVEIPMEPMDIHAHTLWSKLATSLHLFMMTVCIAITTALITLVNVGYDLLIKIDCTAFWTFEPGLARSSTIIPIFGICQYVFFVFSIGVGITALRALLFPKVVETGAVAIHTQTKNVSVQVTTAHQDKKI